jgi:hypothetical protein
LIVESVMVESMIEIAHLPAIHQSRMRTDAVRRHVRWTVVAQELSAVRSTSAGVADRLVIQQAMGVTSGEG